jgi:hypothetical protein
MLRQIVSGMIRVLVGTASGALVGSLYAGLVGVAHRGGFGRWDQIPAFALGSVLVGAAFGLLLACLAWAMPGSATRRESWGWATSPIQPRRAPPARPPLGPVPRNS